MWDEKMESLETVTVYFDSEGNKSEPVLKINISSRRKERRPL